ncbi:MAG: hypothetical protein AAF646_02370 [Pseudomonadota bacterium]
MQTPLLTLAFVTLFAGCATETRIIVPDVPEELRTPVPVPDRDPTNVRELTLLAAEAISSTQAANGKITAIDEILDDAEERAESSATDDGP